MYFPQLPLRLIRYTRVETGRNPLMSSTEDVLLTTTLKKGLKTANV